MFPFGSPYGSSFQSFDPYEQYLAQQELQRRRQAEEYYRRQQLEELNRRRAEQLAYARRQAELQRLREAEALRLREQEMEARRRKLSAPSQPRNLRFRDSVSPEHGAAQRSSMFDGGVQDLFDAIYGDRARRQPSPSSSARRSASSDPRSARVRFEPEQPQEEVVKINLGDSDAVSDTEEPPTTTSQPQPPSTDPAPPTADSADEIQPDEVDTSPSHAAVSNILSKFASLKSDFKFPAALNFLNSPEGNSVTTPKLAYTPNNAPLHQYEHLLTGLLTQLDAVESFGQESIRKARKDAVRAIEQELGELDARKVQEWRRQFTSTESEMPVVDSEMSAAQSQRPMDGDNVPIVDNETPVVDTVLESDSQPELPQNTTATVGTSTLAEAPIIEDAPHDPEVDPVSVPLPTDEDKEMHAETPNAKSPDVPSEPAVPSESVVPSELAALSQPAVVSPPQSSNVLPPVDSTEQSDRSAAPVPAKLESAPSIAAPASTPNQPEPEETNDGHVNAVFAVKPEDAGSRTDDIVKDSSWVVHDD